MIKTVRIASILTALLVVIIVALPVVLGANNSDEKNKESSKIQSVVERFKKTQGERAKKETDQKPPLVKEAEEFALYLNPPPPPKVERVMPPAPRKTAALPVRQDIQRTAKFDLIATCVHESNPSFSFALIDAPGGDRRWVRPSDAIGHLIIQEVKEGSVIINDGTRTYPVDIVARPVETSLVVGNSAADASKSPAGISPVLLNNTGLDRTALIEKQVPATKSAAESIQNRQRSAPARSANEQEIFDKFVEQITSTAVESGDAAAKEQDSEKTNEMIEKFFSEIENMRISGKEAQKLDDLGKKLDSQKKDPNQPEENKAPVSSRRRPPVPR